MAKKIDLIGKKFNMLTVISETEAYKEPSGRYYVRWKCICECGNEKVVRTSSLTSKSSFVISCGCLSAKSTFERTVTHGMSKSKTYTSYNAMKKRCTNKNDPHYHHYGKIGITVCERWLNSFENFLEDMGERPENTSLDRIDNENGYSPENCRWANKKIQQLNRRKNPNCSIIYRGISWSKHYNVWKAQVSINNKNKHIGNYTTELDAAIAYDTFVIENNIPNIINGLVEDTRSKENIITIRS